MTFLEFMTEVMKHGYVVTVSQAESGRYKAGVTNRVREFATAEADTLTEAVVGAIHVLAQRGK